MILSAEHFKEELLFAAKLDIKIDEDKDKNIKITYMADAELIKGDIPEDILPLKIDPKKASFGLVLEGISPQGFIAFQKYSQEVSVKSQALMKKTITPEDADFKKTLNELDEFQQEVQETMLDLGQGLFAPKKGKISYSVSFENKQKKVSHVGVKLAYIGDKLTGNLEDIAQKFKQQALNSFTLDVDANLDETLLLAVQREMNDREKKQINTGIQMGVSQGVVVKKDGVYKVNIDYDPGKLIMNGEDKSEMLEMIKKQMQQ